MISSTIRHQLVDIYGDLYACSVLIQKHENDTKVLVLDPSTDEDSSTSQNILNKTSKKSGSNHYYTLSVSVVK